MAQSVNSNPPLNALACFTWNGTRRRPSGEHQTAAILWQQLEHPGNSHRRHRRHRGRLGARKAEQFPSRHQEGLQVVRSLASTRTARTETADMASWRSALVSSSSNLAVSTWVLRRSRDRMTWRRNADLRTFTSTMCSERSGRASFMGTRRRSPAGSGIKERGRPGGQVSDGEDGLDEETVDRGVGAAAFEGEGRQVDLGVPAASSR